MTKRILPILSLILPFVFVATSIFGISDTIEPNKHSSLLLFVWILLFLILLISNILFVRFNVLHVKNGKFLLFWNMMLKLFHIPVYLLIFSVGSMFAFLPGGIILIPFFIGFDYILLIITSIYGIGGIVQAWREKIFSTLTAVILGVLHVFFCTDVICSVVAFCLLKSKSKKIII